MNFPMTAEEEAKLAHIANALGVPPEALVRQAVGSFLAPATLDSRPQIEDDEWLAPEFRCLSDGW